MQLLRSLTGGGAPGEGDHKDAPPADAAHLAPTDPGPEEPPVLTDEAASACAGKKGKTGPRRVAAVRDPRPPPPAFPECRMPATSLHEAAFLGHLPSIKTFLDEDAAGVNTTLAETSGLSALHLATQQGHVPAMRALLVAGAYPSPICEEGYSPLHLALLQLKGPKGQVEAMLTLLGMAADPNCPTAQGETPLHLAVEESEQETIQVLLQAGARVQAQDDFGWAPLHVAAARGHTAVRLLLDAGASPLIATDDGLTPLHLAAKHGHVEAAQALLGAGASHAATDAVGERPLHYAVRGGHLELIEALLAAGAKPTSAAADGTTPLHLAAERPADGGAALRVMLEGRDPPLPPKKLKKRLKLNGFTPLHLAAHHNNVAAIRALLAAGASVNSVSAHKRTPLHLAAERLHVPAMQELLAGGATFNASDRAGETPLHSVVRGWGPSGAKDICCTAASALLEAGASPVAANKRGETPQSLAAERGSAQLERLLSRALDVKRRSKAASALGLEAGSRGGSFKKAGSGKAWHVFATISGRH